MRWKILRAPITAVTMVDRPGSVRTMSAAPRAASVAPCTAIPTSAFFRAGASFTPSPVMPTTWSQPWRIATISYLCSGNTSAKPLHFSHSSPTSLQPWSAVTSPCLALIKISEGYIIVPMPNILAVSFPMSKWSPVIILTLMPCCWQRSMVSLVSWRGGSNMGNKHIMSQRFSLESPEPSPFAMARPRERNPRRANSTILALTCSLISLEFQALARTTWGEPLHRRKVSPVWLSRTVA
mmetsp:Transcript_8555/g.14701  ORF Transcript_8555/g.14701 Transcript_8555/m.14701 type:complete len:238 (+) Transcript_8555:2074-2787(+)